MPDAAGECGKTSPGNLDTGLLILLKGIVPLLSKSWAKWARWLVACRDRFTWEQIRPDQVSLSLALADLGIVPHVLPAALCGPGDSLRDSGPAQQVEIAAFRCRSELDEEGLPVCEVMAPGSDCAERISGAWQSFAATMRREGGPDLDLLLKRRKRWIQWCNVIEKRGLLLPDHMDREKPIVAIETSGACNYRCAYCPVSVTDRRDGLLPRGTFIKILGDLRPHDGEFQLRLHFYNEPLLDERLREFIRLARRRLPTTFIRVVTNGSLLNVALAEELFSAGLDQIVVSGHRERDVERIIQEFDQHELSGRVAVRRDYLRSAWSDRLSSVALELQNMTSIRPAGVKPWGCNYLTVQVDYLGQIHQCCEDYRGDLVLGNVGDGTVAEILRNHKDRLKRVFCGRFDIPCDHCARATPLR